MQRPGTKKSEETTEESPNEERWSRTAERKSKSCLRKTENNLERHRSRKQIAAEAQQVWKEEIEGKHGGISDRRKMIKSCDER